MGGLKGVVASVSVALLGALATHGQAQERIVFATDRDGDREIYAMDLDGRGQINLSRHPGRDQAPAVSPDGSTIAWMSDRSGELGIWLMDADGSRQRQLRSLPDADFGLAWSPDGARIAVTLQRPDDGAHDLAVVEVADGGITRMTDDAAEQITPGWTPDGDGLYFVSGSGAATSLERLDVGSGVSEAVAADLPSAAFPVVSPDGSAVLIRARTDQFDVLRLDLASGDIENVTANAANDWGAAWSPDGASIVFASDRDGDMEIFLLNLDSGTSSKLTDNNDRDWMPSWKTRP